jgi:DNA-directed RNA polymerase subunit F
MEHRAELVEIIRRVRNRWRVRLALRGAVIVLAGIVLTLFLSASSLEQLRFTPSSIIAFRIVAIVVFAALVIVGLLKPLMRNVTDAQVALYLEECDPTLQTALLSAIEASTSPSAAHSPHLVEKLVEEAVEKCRAADHARVIERATVRRHAATFATIAIVAGTAVIVGPAFLRHGLSALLIVSRSAEAASPYKIDVRPGNAKVPRGADQTIRAKLLGFSSKDVTLMVQTVPGGAYEHVPLVPTSDPAAFEGLLFHLEKESKYFVEANGVRSDVFTMTVVDLPTVAQLELEYRFPPYTGLPPRKVETGGDVAALHGTDVMVRIVPSMKTGAGRLIVNDEGIALAPQADGSLTGSFKIDKRGFYRIELSGPHGEKVDASPQYTIDVVDDQGPSVSFVKPGRDTQASPVDEVFLEAKANDDFGIRQLQLTYTVNGGNTKTIPLFGGGKTLPDVSASHTIYLEELDVKPGDFVSYYAKATDNDAIAGPKTGTSDIYFVQVRPFKKDYKAQQSQAQGGGGQQNNVGQLSEQQRQIVAATFNAVRDKAKTKADKYRENVVFLNLAQGKLREQVQELIGKLTSRLGSDDERFKKIAEALPKAAEEMKAAESQLKTLKADDALPPEQRALKLLQDAEQEYETMVSTQQGGGGGGGGQNAMADDLADLFELELDKLANQYEMQQRAAQQQNDRKIDELAEKLKELARRQLQEAERQRRMAQNQGQAGGGSSAAQRALADEAQEAARRLQQLTREQQRQDLRDAAQRMQEAADAMRQAAANGSKDGGAQANQALDRLKEAQARLARSQAGRGERDLQDAQRQAQELAAEQHDVASQVQGLDQAGAARDAKAKALAQRKDAMDAKVGDLQQQIEKLANDMRGTERDAAHKLDEASGTIRDKRVREKIRYSKNTLNNSGGEYARGMEDDIGANLDALQKKIGDAAGAVGQAKKADALARAAEKARDLVRGVESAQKGSQGSQGSRDSQRPQGQQAGQQGQTGQAGQQGQQGQAGQQGQQGQAGQQGQGQGQGQQNAQAGGGGRNQGPYSGGAARPGTFNGADVRQLRRQAREWQNDAQQLRQQLQTAGLNPKDLDQVMRDLAALDSDLPYADPKGLEQLQAAALEHLKKFEFSLRKKMESGNESLSLSGSDEVPAGFRQAIEEYYRALAKKGGPR